MNRSSIVSLALTGLFITQSSQMQEPEPIPPHAPVEFSYPGTGYPSDKEMTIELVPGATISETIYDRTRNQSDMVERVASTLKTAWTYSMTPYYASYRDDASTRHLSYHDKLAEYKTPVTMSSAEHVDRTRLMDLMDSITRAAANVPFHDPQIMCVKKANEAMFNCTKFERK